jgi:hypothetical protein
MKLLKKFFSIIIIPLIVCIVIAFFVTKYSSFKEIGQSIDSVIYKVIGTEKEIKKAIDKSWKKS